jgi:hypothetical protein
MPIDLASLGKNGENRQKEKQRRTRYNIRYAD